MKVDELTYWINERERMRIRRSTGTSPPWSSDPHMANVRYCNVHREDDKVTQHIRTSSMWGGKSVPVWRVVLARMLNYIPTLESIADHWDGDDFEGLAEGLKAIRASGQKVFTSAYTISTCGQKMDKIDYVIGVVRVVQQKECATDTLPASCCEMWAWLCEVKGLGSFLAAQVVADLKNIPGHFSMLQHAPDWWTFSAPGPGSLRGLNEFWDGERHCTPATYQKDIWDCYYMVHGHIPVMHMQDFQNCLCEFSKYERVKRGGHVRNTYHALKE
jgi:hypothetical protein